MATKRSVSTQSERYFTSHFYLPPGALDPALPNAYVGSSESPPHGYSWWREYSATGTIVKEPSLEVVRKWIAQLLAPQLGSRLGGKVADSIPQELLHAIRLAKTRKKAKSGSQKKKSKR